MPPADPTPAGTAPSGLSASDALGIFRPGWLRRLLVLAFQARRVDVTSLFGITNQFERIPMDSLAEIRNCEFRVKCPRQWTELQETRNEKIRFCGSCKRSVHYCKTPAELQRAIIKNYCVAVELKKERGARLQVLLGDVMF